MKKFLICCCLTLLSCSIVRAELLDFTGSGTDPNVFITNTPMLTGVSLGNGVTADITADNMNSANSDNFITRQFNAGMGLQANGNQLNTNQLIQVTFTNVMLNGQPVPAGTTVDFTLNYYLFTDPNGRGFLFDGSLNRPSAMVLGADSNPSFAVFDAGVFDSADLNASEATAANLSPFDLAFSTAVGAETYQLAPDQEFKFTNFFGVRNVDHPTFLPNAPDNINGVVDTYFLQGFDVTANVNTANVLKGDLNLDGGVTFLDITPFILVLSNSGNQPEADCNCDGTVDFFDIQSFINILAGN